MANSFLFHDYETFGADPARDGIAQFAAIRTDDQLQPIGDPVSVYCQPSADRLPHPGACLVTGITPQQALAEGLTEVGFAAQVHACMIEPGTCSLGYNSIRFDDAFTRQLLWRNFYDPYQREWKDGNSRFDLIDLTRLCYALRPDGIEWPRRDDGAPSFRLEHLARANSLDQARAHDALSDVHATIGLARMIRSAQPRLWQYALRLRDKRHVLGLLDWTGATPLLHASEKIPAERGCTSLVLPMAPAPGAGNGVIVVDLMADPEPLLSCDAEELRDRLYTPSADLPEGIERPAIKIVHGNRCPMLAPLSTLADTDVGRIGLDPDRCQRNRERLLASADLRQKLVEVFQQAGSEPPADPELSLYSGGFPSPAERARLERVRRSAPDVLATTEFDFEQDRHHELLFRYRARNWPDTMNESERQRWRDFVASRLSGEHALAHYRDQVFDLRTCRAEIAAERAVRPAGPDHAVLDQLEAWTHDLERTWL